MELVKTLWIYGGIMSFTTWMNLTVSLTVRFAELWPGNEIWIFTWRYKDIKLKIGRKFQFTNNSILINHCNLPQFLSKLKIKE